MTRLLACPAPRAPARPAPALRMRELGLGLGRAGAVRGLGEGRRGSSGGDEVSPLWIPDVLYYYIRVILLVSPRFREDIAQGAGERRAQDSARETQVGRGGSVEAHPALWPGYVIGYVMVTAISQRIAGLNEVAC